MINSIKETDTPDPYLTMKSYLSIGNKLNGALLTSVAAILAIVVLGVSDLGLTSAMRLNLMSAIAIVAFFVPLLMIALVSLKLNKNI